MCGYIRRLNALHCSQVGQLRPSPQALCLGATFCLVFLSDQEISHSIRLKRSLPSDKAYAEGAPSPHCSICLLRLAPCLSTQDIFFSPAISLPHSISLHPLSNSVYLLFPRLTIRITYLFSSSLQMLLILLSSRYLRQMLCQIPLLSNISGWRYACFFLFAASVVNYFCFIFRCSKDIRAKLLSLEPCSAPQCVL